MISVIDSFTQYVLEFMEGINKTSQMLMQDLVYTLTKTYYTLLAVYSRLH